MHLIYKKKWIKKEKAQSAMFDALIFFILMLISSSILLYYTTNVTKPVSIISKQDRNTEFTYALLIAYLTSTIHNTSYKTTVPELGEVDVVLEDEAVVEIIMEILWLKKYNPSAKTHKMAFDIYQSLFNLTHYTGANDPLVISSGINQTTFHFFLQARYDPPTGGPATILNITDHHNSAVYGPYDSQLFKCNWVNSPADYADPSFGALQRCAMLNDQWGNNGNGVGNVTIQLKLWKT
ncbi:MAG: hypothetical protein QW728_01655 [Thermoplasmata archaeon]